MRSLGDFVAVAVFAYDLENCVAVAFGFGESYVGDLEELLLGLRKVGGEIIKDLVAQNLEGGGGETFRLFFIILAQIVREKLTRAGLLHVGCAERGLDLVT